MRGTLGLALVLAALLWSGGAEAACYWKYGSWPKVSSPTAACNSGGASGIYAKREGGSWGCYTVWTQGQPPPGVSNLGDEYRINMSIMFQGCDGDGSSPDDYDPDTGQPKPDADGDGIPDYRDPTPTGEPEGGEEGEGGQSCGEGESWNEGTQQCEPEEQAPQCEAPEVWNSQTQMCDPPACAEGESYNYTTRQCEPQANACEVHAGQNDGAVGALKPGASAPSGICKQGCWMELDATYSSSSVPQHLLDQLPYDPAPYIEDGASWAGYAWPSSDVQSCDGNSAWPRYELAPDSEEQCPIGWVTDVTDSGTVCVPPTYDGGDDEGGGDTGGGDDGGGDAGGGGDDDDNSGPQGDGGQDPGGEDAGGDDDTPGGDGGGSDTPGGDDGGEGEGTPDDTGSPGGDDTPGGTDDDDPGGEDGGGDPGGEEGPGDGDEPPGDGEGDEEVECDPATEACEGSEFGAGEWRIFTAEDFYQTRYPNGHQAAVDAAVDGLMNTPPVAWAKGYFNVQGGAYVQCPAFELPLPYWGTVRLEPPCEIWDIIRTLVLGFAAVSAAWFVISGLLPRGAD